MQIEVRSDNEARITGYVNATEKLSRPVITPHGKVIEVIEPRAFGEAIAAGWDSITLNVDHDKGSVYARTSDGTLTLTEDAIGLHADVLIRDPTLIALAREGKIRGWSFGMFNVRDELEQRADALPIRHVKGMDLDHVSLIVNQTPVYSATSVEVRADAALGYTWKLYVENRTDKNLMFTFEKAAVNGVMCDPFWAEVITAGKKGNCEVTWMRDAFEARSIGDVYEVDFTLNVYNDDDYTEAPLMHDPFEVFPMGEEKAAEASAADEAARAKLLAGSGKVLVDNDDCSIVVTGYEPDNTWGYAMHVYLRNKSGEDLVFSAQNTSVNGIMCDPYWSEIVTSGKSAISTILWDKSALSENDITEVNQISLPLMVYSDKNIAQPYVDKTFELEP